MENKKKRLLFRIFLLGVMAIVIFYAVYQNSIDDQKNALATKGEKATNFSGETILGEKIELKETGTEKTLINFWGSWCEPCKREMPALETAYSKYNSDDFTIISVNVGESKFVIDKFINQYNLSFPIISDRDSSIRQAYHVGNLPVTFLVDSEGIVEEVHEGELTEEMLNDWINVSVK